MSSLKSAAIYLPGLLVQRAMSLALVITMTHFIPKAEYGLFTLVITVGELIDTSMTTWVRLALLRLGSGSSVSTNLAHVILKTVFLTTGGGCLVGLATAYLLIGDNFIEFWLAVSCYTVSISLMRFGLALLQAKNKSLLYSGIEVIRAVSSFSLAFAALKLVGQRFLYPSLFISLNTLFFALIAMFLGLRNLKPAAKVVTMRDVAGFAGPLLILSILTIIANAMDRLVLQYYWAAAAVGGYAATYALARQPVDVLANAINTGGYPALVRQYEEGGREEAKAFLIDQVGFFLKLVIPVCAVLFLVRYDIIQSVLPAEYHETAGQIFGWILVAAVAYNLRSSIFDNVFLVEQKNYLQLRYFVFVFLAGLLVAAFFVPLMAAKGSALVFVTWASLALALSAWTGRTLIPVGPSRADLLRTALLTVVSCGGAMAVRLLLTNSPPFMRLLGEGGGAGIGYVATIALLYFEQTRYNLISARRWIRSRTA